MEKSIRAYVEAGTDSANITYSRLDPINKTLVWKSLRLKRRSEVVVRGKTGRKNGVGNSTFALGLIPPPRIARPNPHPPRRPYFFFNSPDITHQAICMPVLIRPHPPKRDIFVLLLPLREAAYGRRAALTYNLFSIRAPNKRELYFSNCPSLRPLSSDSARFP